MHGRRLHDVLHDLHLGRYSPVFDLDLVLALLLCTGYCLSTAWALLGDLRNHVPRALFIIIASCIEHGVENGTGVLDGAQRLQTGDLLVGRFVVLRFER